MFIKAPTNFHDYSAIEDFDFNNTLAHNVSRVYTKNKNVMSTPKKPTPAPSRFFMANEIQSDPELSSYLKRRSKVIPTPCTVTSNSCRSPEATEMPDNILDSPTPNHTSNLGMGLA